jgi:hypothetical protein
MGFQLTTKMMVMTMVVDGWRMVVRGGIQCIACSRPWAQSSQKP